MGVSVTVRDGVTHITGRVQMLASGLPCLTCTGSAISALKPVLAAPSPSSRTAADLNSNELNCTALAQSASRAVAGDVFDFSE